MLPPGDLARRTQDDLDALETALEAVVGGAQRLLRVDAHMAGQVDAGEQQVADLVDALGGVGVGGEGLGALVELLADLVGDAL